MPSFTLQKNNMPSNYLVRVGEKRRQIYVHRKTERERERGEKGDRLKIIKEKTDHRTGVEEEEGRKGKVRSHTRVWKFRSEGPGVVLPFENRRSPLNRWQDKYLLSWCIFSRHIEL